ncbi:MAG: ABC transporter ATP-binding protein [Hyphomicrobiaceae bacterium]|nr:ABC transporter ATP-binding protein [Hyphomicrobiaceae bacterium]
MPALLEVDGLSKSFSGLRAVSNLTFSVGQGELAALIGPNGAGKTTCFSMIAGVIRPDAGRVHLDGRRVDGLRADQICRAGVGRTFQVVKPFAGLSVLDNVIVGALNTHRTVAGASRAADEVLDLLGLAAKRGHPAASLTLPERKRLEVARALATGPRLLLLDEVMAGLRPTEIDLMVQVLRDLNARRGITILLIEHVMRAVMALARRVIVMHHGEIIARGTPQEVTRNPAVIESYLGEEAV